MIVASEAPLRSLHGGNAEQGDFGRGVEAEAEQESDRKHVPASGDEAEQRTEEAGEEAATVEQDVEIVLDERLAVLHRLKRAVDRHQDDDVEDRDGEQEQRRDAGADDPADRLERIEERGERRRGDGDAERISTTTAEWPSEKKKPTPTGRWPCCMSLRVTLSIAAIWSASTAWRRPNV